MAITKITRDALNTGIDDNSDATAITIDSSEQVGIGTATPTGVKLHVAGGVKATDLVSHDSTGINLQTDEGTKRLILDDSGRITMPSQPGASAGISGSQGNGSTVVAGHVHHNVGNHYNSSTGVFTCPVSGRYLVSIFAMSGGSGYTLDVQLRRNNADYQGLVPYNSASGGFHNQVGGMAIVNCSANDTLKFHNGSGGSLYGGSSGRHSCINFYLLG